MVIKKFRRKCDVRGCKNTANVYILSKYKDIGNSIAICTDCLNKAKALIDAKENVTTSSVAEVVPEPVEVIEDDKTEEQTVTEDSVTNEEAVISIIEPKTEPQGKKKSNKKK